jgi:hypothetical protein
MNGRIFIMYKLRTMRHDAEAASGPVWATDEDPRVTAVGRFLRKLHLDELPQLFNVVRGDMDLFGPRPERPEFVEFLSRQIVGYERRLRVRPGVSGLAQINLPPDTDFDSVRRKLVLDNFYINNAGPWLDAQMFLCSLLRLVGVPGHLAMQWLALDFRGLLVTPLDGQGLQGDRRPEPIQVPTPWRDYFDAYPHAAFGPTPALALGEVAAK